MSAEGRGPGNGLLYAALGLGIALVLGGVALEIMPEPSEYVPEPAPEPAPWDDVQPTPEPLPPDPQLDPLPEPSPIEPLVDDEPGPPLFWHAAWPSAPATACVLAVETTSIAGLMVRMTLACADGRLLQGRIVPTSPGGEETLGASNAVVYRADFEALVLDRTGVGFEIDVDTSAHRLDVTQTNLGRTTSLYVEDLSVPVPSVGGIFDSTEVGFAASRLAVPTVVTGSIPVSVALVRGTGREPRPSDPVCELFAGPVVNSGFNCRVVVRCNGEILYGAGTGGYNRCVQRDGRIERASDSGASIEDTDPRLELDLSAGTLTVSDITDTTQWSASFELLPDPRCDLASFEGRAAPLAADQPWEDWQLVAGSPPRMTAAEGVAALDSLTMRCLDAEAIARRGGETITLRFGPGSASLAGYASRTEGPPTGIYAFRVVE